MKDCSFHSSSAIGEHGYQPSCVYPQRNRGNFCVSIWCFGLRQKSSRLVQGFSARHGQDGLQGEALNNNMLRNLTMFFFSALFFEASGAIEGDEVLSWRYCDESDALVVEQIVDWSELDYLIWWAYARQSYNFSIFLYFRMDLPMVVTWWMITMSSAYWLVVRVSRASKSAKFCMHSSGPAGILVLSRISGPGFRLPKLH